MTLRDDMKKPAFAGFFMSLKLVFLCF